MPEPKPSDSKPSPAASAPKLPSITAPKGGGAIHGIGEKFTANPVAGTGSMSVPIAVSPGRSGFGPQLALTYDSGSGNGPFGFGWSLAIPAISRKTDKGLPRYMDAQESDVFLIAGAEDLVPVLLKDGMRFVDDKTFPGFTIHRYRPRIEGLFARIERWTDDKSGAVHWRSITRDNVTTLYGKTADSQVADPADPSRVFSWLVCASYDDKGNALVYEYATEGDAGVDKTQANERHRTRTANRYVKRIKYGNRVSRLVQPDLSKMEWLFEVVFDYEEGHYAEVPLDASKPADQQHRYVRAAEQGPTPWTVRPDPFSNYRAGFERRTYRRCRRVLMFHRFAELGAEPCLVRSTDFDYADLDYSTSSSIADELAYQGSTRVASFLRAVTQYGYVRDQNTAVLPQNGVNYVPYLRKGMPPVEFEYSKAAIQDDVRELDAESLENAPVGLSGNHQWVDLDGEGVSGLLTEQAGAWYYKPNLGDGRLGPQTAVAAKPSTAALSGGRQQLLSLAGDGRLDLADFSGPTPGFFKRMPDADWEPFKNFRSRPDIRWDEPNLRFVDLDGDGLADVLITEQDVFTWHQSLLEDGFGHARRALQPQDEEEGPKLVFADGEQSVYLADMTGDGLTDLVRVRDGEVCYWPNLGYGRFGAKVAMDDAPRFEESDQFDHRRVRLADIDGSGTNDIIYLGRDGARVYFNLSGNRWSAPRALASFPHLDDVSAVQTADLLGNGTACLVWSSPLPTDGPRPVRYIDLMGGTKPHLLVKSANNLGAETVIHYAPSTKFYLADKAAGKPWITRLSFPVYVVERVETYDRISGNRFVTRYAYHHGYFDGFERELRGFGMVEQWDTEEFAALNPDGAFPTGTNFDASSHVPPVHTKTWFHTGVYAGRDRVSRLYAAEYFREPGLTDQQFSDLLLDDTVLPDGLTLDEEREACRALKGSMLRQEVYGLDGSAKEPFPYTVAEQNFTIRPLQSMGTNRHAVFLTHACEAISYHYERNPSDPRVSHALTLEVDDYGGVKKSAAVGYGRRAPDAALDKQDQQKQAVTLVTYSENDYTNAIDDAKYPDDYRAPLTCESRSYELTGFTPSGPSGRFLASDLVTSSGAGYVAVAAGDLSYEQPATGGLQRRLLSRSRTLFRPNDCGGSKNDPLALLDKAVLEPLALPGESYTLALTQGMLSGVNSVFLRPRDGQPDEVLIPDPAGTLGSRGGQGGGYVDLDGDKNWWIPTGRVFLSASAADTPAQELSVAQTHFFLPRRVRDPFHTDASSTETVAAYDSYDLLPQETNDPLGNRVTCGERDPDPTKPPVSGGIDYRVMLPFLVMDPNRNRATAAFDALGMVVATAVMGKPEDRPAKGDSLDGLEADLTDAVIAAHLTVPLTDPHAILVKATTRLVYDLFAYQRTIGQAQPEPVVAYSLARETHESDLANGDKTKVQHAFAYSDGFGREIQRKIRAEPGDDGKPRWVGSGWTIVNNKGKPVRKYEPFFSATQSFEFGVKVGVSSILFYDPVERVIGTLKPDHTWEKVVFDAWKQETWDANDTVLLDPKSDPDLKDHFSRLPSEDYTPTWYAKKKSGVDGPEEQSAADKTAVHAGTSTLAYADSLGRAFLTVAQNTYKRSDAKPQDPPTADPPSRSRAVFDVQGDVLEVWDAKQRLVMRYDYDLLKSRVHQASMEAGERWSLGDATGKPLMAWDSRGQTFSTTFDALRRPVASLQSAGGAPQTVGRTIYGEGPGAEQHNLRGKVNQVYDQAGLVTTPDYDFKGNPLGSSRQLAKEYARTLNWADPEVLEQEHFLSSTTFDALNRPVLLIAPHSDLPGHQSNVILPTYNEAGLLETMSVNLRGAAQATPFVTNLDYDAKGRRTQIDYATQDGKGITTTYAYDPQTLRLIGLKTRRKSAAFDGTDRPGEVQALSYVYDPVGNITYIHDDAQDTIFFQNKKVEPSNDYYYDSLYRLIDAIGREHLGQTNNKPNPPNPPAAFDTFHNSPSFLPQTTDGYALGTYLEQYAYDAVGNILSLQHRGSDPANPGWTRSYAYTEPSQLANDPKIYSNRLTSTTIGQSVDAYKYDAPAGKHGNMTFMPHLPVMQWDFNDRLQATSRQSVNDGSTPETTWYVYDSSGKRVRKVTDNAALANAQPTRKNERIYLAGWEVYRSYNGDVTKPVLERETLHVTDDKRRIALVETRTVGDEPDVSAQLIRYQMCNYVGSSVLELDERAAIVSYEEYFPFGATSYAAVRADIEVAKKRYRFADKECDEESGLYYVGARYYACWLGRWINCDPISLSGGINLYLYANANPVVFVDPSGQAPKKPGHFGDVNRHGSQGLRGQGTSGALESEHIDPIALQRENMRNPRTGKSPIPEGRGSAIDRGQATVMLKKATADAKTRLDMAVYNKLKAEQRTGQVSEGTAKQLGPKAGLERTAAAAKATGTTVPSGAYLAAAGQVDALHADPAVRTFSRNPANNPLAGATDADMAAWETSFDNGTPSADYLLSAPATKNPKAGSLFKGNFEPAPSALSTGVKVFGGAALVGAAGTAAAQLYEGRKTDAAITVGSTAVLTAVMTKVPALVPLAVMKSTIDSYDENVERHAFAAGDWVERNTGSSVAGGLTSAAAATGESLFQGTFGAVGKGIGEGAAAVYLWATGQ